MPIDCRAHYTSTKFGVDSSSRISVPARNKQIHTDTHKVTDVTDHPIPTHRLLPASVKPAFHDADADADADTDTDILARIVARCVVAMRSVAKLYSGRLSAEEVNLQDEVALFDEPMLFEIAEQVAGEHEQVVAVLVHHERPLSVHQRPVSVQ